MQAAGAAMAKDYKQLASGITSATNGAKKKLTDKFQVIEEISNKFQQVCASLRQTHGKLSRQRIAIIRTSLCTIELLPVRTY